MTLKVQNLHGDAILTFWVDEDVKSALTQVAKRNGRSRSEEMRRALATHLVAEMERLDRAAAAGKDHFARVELNVRERQHRAFATPGS